MTLRNRGRQKIRRPIDKPPQQFPTVIKSHPYDESGLKTCLICGQKKDFRLHIRPHSYQRNYSSKLKRCMCGLNPVHELHLEAR